MTGIEASGRCRRAWLTSGEGLVTAHDYSAMGGAREGAAQGRHDARPSRPGGAYVKALKRYAVPMALSKNAASSSMASRGSTCETYWSGRTTMTAPWRSMPRASKMSASGSMA